MWRVIEYLTYIMCIHFMFNFKMFDSTTQLADFFHKKHYKGRCKPRRYNTSLTPTKAEETFAYDAVSKTASHGHVRLPCLRENPTERGQEEEVQKCSHKSTNNLRARK